MKKIFLGFLLALVLVTGCATEELDLIPKEKAVVSGGAIYTGTEVGTGWSAKEDAGEAMEESVNIALEGKSDKTPDIAIIFASSGSDMQAIQSKAKELLGDGIKIYGGTSDSRGVMTDKGFVNAEEKGYSKESMEGKHALAIMTITSEDIDFGVGSANYDDYPSLREAAKAAVLAAITSAGKTRDELPRVVLITPTLGMEDDAVQGVEDVVGKDIPILGGTTGGPTFGVFGKDAVYEKGVSLAVIYTDLQIGWIFEGGFDVTAAETGIATKVDGQAIVEIDNRPALDVYDEWLDGEIDRLYEEVGDPSVIRDILTLHPLYRKYTTPDGKGYQLFSHPWPKDDTLVDRSVMTSTNIQTGERIYLSHGTWETLLNRIGNTPIKAKAHAEITGEPLFGIGIVCGGVMGTIPEEGREKMPVLINYANNNAPFIASFTWGEQGHYPGLGSKHGNLQTGFLVVGGK